MTVTVGLKRSDTLATVRSHQTILQNMGVISLYLFGSVARDEATPTSDVDFLVEFAKPIGLFQLFLVQHYLEDVLHCKVDLGTADALREHLREPVLKDAIRVF
jgi:hypothetical protein